MRLALLCTIVCNQNQLQEANLHYLSLFVSVHCLSSFLSALPLNCAACLGGGWIRLPSKDLTFFV